MGEQRLVRRWAEPVRVRVRSGFYCAIKGGTRLQYREANGLIKLPPTSFTSSGDQIPLHLQSMVGSQRREAIAESLHWVGPKVGVGFSIRCYGKYSIICYLNIKLESTDIQLHLFIVGLCFKDMGGWRQFLSVDSFPRSVFNPLVHTCFLRASLWC